MATNNSTSETNLLHKFALAALNGGLAQGDYYRGEWRYSPETIAARAYEIAQAMVNESGHQAVIDGQCAERRALKDATSTKEESTSEDLTVKTARTLSLALETRAALPTSEAARHLNRAQQTLRMWAMREDGPLRPLRVSGRLAWPTADIRKLLGIVVS